MNLKGLGTVRMKAQKSVVYSDNLTHIFMFQRKKVEAKYASTALEHHSK